MDATEERPCIIVAIGVRNSQKTPVACEDLETTSFDRDAAPTCYSNSWSSFRCFHLWKVECRCSVRSVLCILNVQVGFIWEVEQDLATRFNCTVLMFDPTPGSGLGVRSRDRVP